jgi:hypothetical protein
MAFLRRVTGAIAIAATGCALFGSTALAEQRTATAEDDIKAAFLLNFTRFVEWPAAAATGPFRLCTVAEPAFDGAVNRAIAGESTNGRPIVRVSPETPDAARSCHMLFLSRLEGGRAARWLSAVRGLPVLVVGETRSLTDGGAAITFVVEDNRVKFDVNAAAAADAGLQVSSKLLRVARHVNARSTR